MNRVNFGTVIAALLIACGGREQPPPRSPDSAAAPAPVPIMAPQSSTQSQVRISEDIRRACGISEADAHFDFDSARVRNTDYPALQKLISCFTAGALARRHMRLVGHADPRGDEEYNLVLGNSRADGVKDFFIARGLSREQVATTSRGEMDARGLDEASWASDRRVDVLLVN